MLRQSPPAPHPKTSRPTMKGTAIVGGFRYFIERYGNAAAHEVVSRAPPDVRAQLQPNAPLLGLLGNRSYATWFIGELVRIMGSVARRPEEEFIRELADAGLTSSLGTVNRVALRYLTSIPSLAARAPEVWRMFHDDGRLTVISCTDREYVVQVSDWATHDPVVCRLSMEARRGLVARAGARDVILLRDKCLTWGNDVCTSRIRWA